MLFLKFCWFVRTAKWETINTSVFFNKEKGFTLSIYRRDTQLEPALPYSRSSSKRMIVEIRTSEDTRMEYSGFRSWVIRRYFKKIDNRIKRQERKEERRQIKEQRKKERTNLLLALNRQSYVEIKFDHENSEYKINEWLEQKKYSYEKYSQRHDKGIYYFMNKDHATEFKMVWG